MAQRKIGFIGLGTMGLPMARNVLAANGQLLVSDLVETPKDEIRSLGGSVAADNAQVSAECDIIFLSLPTVKVVQMVTDDLIARGRSGQYIIDTSTIGFQMSQDICARAKAKGIHYIDTPISGGAGRAADGTLSIITGAGKDEMEAAGIAPILNAMGKEVHYAGTRGGGVALKIINNSLSKAILFADAEAVVMSEHMGIPFDTLYDVIQSSSSQNEIFRIKKEHIAHNEYGKSNKSYSPITMSLKDLKLARELADEMEIACFSTNNAIQWYEIGMKRGYAEKDSSSIVGLMRELQPVRKED